METRRELRDRLNKARLSEETIEALLRATARQRHEARVRAAEAAALAWAEALGLDQDAAAALCWGESRGLYGVRGAGTARHDAFVELGKGRHQASDGRAWDAAIEAASYRLAGGIFQPWAPGLAALASNIDNVAWGNLLHHIATNAALTDEVLQVIALADKARSGEKE